MYGEPGFNWLDPKTHTVYKMDWIGDYFIDNIKCVCFQASFEWQDDKKIPTDFLDVRVQSMVKTENGWLMPRHNSAQTNNYIMPIDKFMKKTEGQSKEK